MADKDNQSQEQPPAGAAEKNATPVGAEADGGPMKTGTSPELESLAQREGEKAVADKIAEARQGVRDKGEAGATPGAEIKAKPAVAKTPTRAVVQMATAEIKDDPLIEALKKKFTTAILEAFEINGQQVVRVEAAAAHDLLLYLRDEAQPAFNMLTDLTAVHLPERERQFDIVYHPYAIDARRRLRVKAAISENEAIASVCDIWSTANWLEREAFDLFGIRFSNHPDMRRILLPLGWVGHPLRKEHPLEYRDNEWVAQNLKIRELPEEADYTGKFE